MNQMNINVKKINYGYLDCSNNSYFNFFFLEKIHYCCLKSVVDIQIVKECIKVTSVKLSAVVHSMKD